MTAPDKAPERIWAYDDGAHIMAFDWKANVDGIAEYIRADVADAMVAVKPLEWRHVPNEPQGYTWRAKKPFGSSYYLHEKDGLHSWGGGYVSLEDAKAAAQADYEKRILSALQSPSDARAALAEAERKAVKAVEEGPAGTARALEIILSRLKFDDQTASILKYQLGSERKSAAALKKEAS